MKKLFLLLLFTCTLVDLCPTLSAQTETRPYWETSPEFASEDKDLVLNVLDSLALIKLPHRIYEELELLAVEKDLLSLKTSASGQWSLRLLPLPNGTPLLALIRTVNTPIGDSALQFYTPSWEEIKDSNAVFSAPRASDFIPTSMSATDRARLEQLLYPLYLVYKWAPQSRLEVSVSTPTLLSDATREADRKLIEAIPHKKYQWKGGHFVLLNQ